MKSPLSVGQIGLWHLCQNDEVVSTAYNVVAAYRSTPLHASALEASLQALECRHPILASRIEEYDSGLHFVSGATTTLKLARAVGTVESVSKIEMTRAFDFSEGPLFRITLVDTVDGLCDGLVVCMPHLAVDGASISVLLSDLAEAYAHQLTGSPCDPQASYAAETVVPREVEFLNSPEFARQICASVQALHDVPPGLALFAQTEFGHVVYDAAVCALELGGEETSALYEFSNEHGVTPAAIHLTALQILLWRYTQQTDFSVNIPVSTRDDDQAGVVGYLTNLGVVRASVHGTTASSSLLDMVADSLYCLLDRRSVPFPSLVLALKAQGARSVAGLMQTCFNYERINRGDISFGPATLRAVPISTRYAKNQIKLDIEDGGLNGVRCTLTYDSGSLTSAVAERMLTHYRILLEAVVKQPQARVCDLPMLTPAENRQILESWNQTSKPYDSSYCLHELFEAQATATPDAVAVTSPTDQLSYAELEAHANQLAHILRARGVGPDTRVGVCIERGTKLVIALLGVLKAGGAYVPLDPAYPRDRLGYMLEDASASILLTQSHLLTYFPEHEGIVCLDTEWEQIVQEPTTRLPQIAGPANLAYCIYTSGSTGQPKGVALQHSNAVAFIDWALHTFTASQTACVLASTSICFDLSVFELFVPLARGGHVLIVQDVLALASDATLAPTLINTVPSAMRALLDSGVLPASANTINLAGEPLPPSLLAQLHERSPDIMVWNLYGPTEYTTYATCAKLDIGRSVTIGRPLANTQIYVLDSRLAPVPVGVAGEIYIAGDGLARGYLARPELTAERFIPNPFGPSGSRMYRTGDLGKFQPDGTIDYLGRIDYQVKIRGFRIELGEIENVTRAYPGVADAVIVAREAADGPRLLAYVVARSGYALSATDLRAHAKKSLPDYMLPSSWTFLEALPMTLNGKVDRNALPNPDISETPSTDYAAPRTPTEHALAAIWCEVLGLERVSIHDDFFTLGGHSLLVTRLVRRMLESFGVRLPTQSLFDAPTLAAVAALIDCAQAQPETGGAKVHSVRRQARTRSSQDHS